MNEIEIHLRARYPLIYLISWEETRLLESLSSTCALLEKDLYVWTVTDGLWRYSDPKEKDDTRNSPMAVLDAICSLKARAKSVFALLDFHPYLDDPGIRRKLRDAARKLKAGNSSLILVSPVQIVPPELAKEMAVLDFDLPSPDELTGALEQFLEAVTNKLRLKCSITKPGMEKIVKASMGLTLDEFENVLSKCAILHEEIDLGIIPDIIAEKKQIIRKSGILEYYAPEENLQQVGGLENLKIWLKQRAEAFTQKARDFGLPEPRGLLLVGVQGCGKSLTAKAVGATWKLPLLRLDVGRVFSGIVGSSEENVRMAVKTAESISPCIMWIDEIEKGLAGTASSNYTDSGTTARVFGTFTTWLQEKTRPVFVIATANEIQQLPPELMRKGRFDEIFFVDLPNYEERSEILRIHLRKRNRDFTTFDVGRIAAETEGFSGAELEQCIIGGLYDAFDAQRPMATTDIIRNVAETVPLSRMMAEHVQALRSWALERARPASARAMEE
ncbi:MAG TPA: AAA family ATPase [Candidatus Brocadiia bacterium]|nr:AAA family ATPase [Candidatus Brocadiia bacterium]